MFFHGKSIRQWIASIGGSDGSHSITQRLAWFRHWFWRPPRSSTTWEGFLPTIVPYHEWQKRRHTGREGRSHLDSANIGTIPPQTLPYTNYEWYTFVGRLGTFLPIMSKSVITVGANVKIWRMTSFTGSLTMSNHRSASFSVDTSDSARYYSTDQLFRYKFYNTHP